MRVVCVWRRESDYGRATEEWMRDLERLTGKEVESMTPDSREGEGFCRTYDIVEYPTIVAVGPDGKELASWRGKQLPLLNEVAYWM